MLGQNPSQQAIYQMTDLESLVPKNHRLRQIDAALDLRFVREALADCYVSGKGRPSVDPELVIRMMILGVLYDLSDRQLCDEVRMHAGFRWFCRLNFHDPVPDHSTLSRLRNERWAGSDVFQRLFEQVLSQCVAAGLISGRHVSVDGTQIQANASMKSLQPRSDSGDDEVEGPPSDQSPGAGDLREPQPKGAWQGHGEKYSNETHYSRTDPDARLYCKGPHERGSLSYLSHNLIDTKGRVILGCMTTHATGFAEREAALALLNEHALRRERLGLDQAVEILTADKGYGPSDFVADLIDRGITPHVPLRANLELEPVPVYQRRTFKLAQQRKRLERIRLVKARNATRLAMATHGYAVSRKLRTRSEHLFAEAKNEHGLGQAQLRGLVKVNWRCQMIATVQNLKRLVQHTRRKAQGAVASLVHAQIRAQNRLTDLRRHHCHRVGQPIRSFQTASRYMTTISQRGTPYCSTAF
jgi:transposase